MTIADNLANIETAWQLYTREPTKLNADRISDLFDKLKSAVSEERRKAALEVRQQGILHAKQLAKEELHRLLAIQHAGLKVGAEAVVNELNSLMEHAKSNGTVADDLATSLQSHLNTIKMTPERLLNAQERLEVDYRGRLDKALASGGASELTDHMPAPAELEWLCGKVKTLLPPPAPAQPASAGKPIPRATLIPTTRLVLLVATEATLFLLAIGCQAYPRPWILPSMLGILGTRLVLLPTVLSKGG